MAMGLGCAEGTICGGGILVPGIHARQVLVPVLRELGGSPHSLERQVLTVAFS